MVIGILKEPPGETRVSLLPEGAVQLKAAGADVQVESRAGFLAYADDGDYEAAGIPVSSRDVLLQTADMLLSIQPPSAEDLKRARPGTVWVGIYDPLYHKTLMEQMASLQLTVFSLDNVPRSTRAQNMDVRSSQANIAGYKAVLLAAYSFSRYFPMLMTAAGSIAPAKLLVLGAGVAGLQAIATGRRLGAVVEAFDTRPQVKEEVMSLGARFVEVEGARDASDAGGYAVEQTEQYQQRQQEKIAERVGKADIVITTAQIPGKKAPVLITRPMIEQMRKGSVIVDLASATGGNTELTADGETVHYKGVTIIGDADLARAMPADASKLYGKNVLNFLKLIVDEGGQLKLDFSDELVTGTCITHDGKVTNERVLASYGEPSAT